jgi:uncharacterized protein YjbI with pentapeptide repeats
MLQRQNPSLVQVLTRAEKATLPFSEYRRACLAQVDLSQADLRNAIFEEVSLVGVDFSNADLRGTIFRACDLRRARFRGARWGANVFTGSLFTHSSGFTVDHAQEIVSLGGHFADVRRERVRLVRLVSREPRW